MDRIDPEPGRDVEEVPVAVGGLVLRLVDFVLVVALAVRGA
jgi:hypothetical protein